MALNKSPFSKEGISMNNPQQNSTNAQSANAVYNAAATTQAGDYDSIMQGYKNLNNSNNSQGGNQNFGSSGLNYNPQTPIFNKYTQSDPYTNSANYTNLYGQLNEFAKTGGYSDSDRSDIRARGVSPIRSAYSSAQRGVNRQNSLQGGYSPNQGALIAKMAREQAGQMGQASTNVNARLAEMIQSGKSGAMSNMSSLVNNEDSRRNEYNQRETDAARRVNEENTAIGNKVNSENEARRLQIANYNAGVDQQNSNNQLQSLQGQQSLYGTTPALTRTFGDQALQNNQQQMQAVQTANMLKQQRSNTGLNLVQNQLMGRS